MKGHPEQDLVNDTVEPNELWHRRLAHVHYKALPLARKAIEGLLEIQAKHPQKRHFQIVRAKQNESWKSFTLMYVVQCHQVH